jgi:thioredoxin reductase (NADPH)
MQRKEHWDVLIIGAGIAGLSTAIWAQRLGLNALVLEQQPSVGGQLRWISPPIEDYPGLPATPGSAFAGQLEEQAESAGAVIHPEERVTSVDLDAKRCDTASGSYWGHALVIATGISPRRLDIPGEETVQSMGLVRRPSLELEWFRHKDVAVIGGGDRAVENALKLAPVTRKVYLIHHKEQLRARSDFQADLMRAEGVRFWRNSRVTAITPPGCRIALQIDQEGNSRSLEVDALCVYIGNRPNTRFLLGRVGTAKAGYVTTDAFGQTELPGVYAVGDVCTPPEFQSLISAAGQAMVVAKQIALTGRRGE